jgi:acyl carrier protein
VVNLRKLTQAFQVGLGLPEDREVSGLAYRQIAEWDSVAHMQLVMEIETAFDIMLSTEDVIALSSFDAAQTIVTRHGIAFP